MTSVGAYYNSPETTDRTPRLPSSVIVDPAHPNPWSQAKSRGGHGSEAECLGYNATVRTGGFEQAASSAPKTREGAP